MGQVLNIELLSYGKKYQKQQKKNQPKTKKKPSRRSELFPKLSEFGAKHTGQPNTYEAACASSESLQ